MTNKHLCIGAILLGAGVISSVGAIAAQISIETVPVGNANNDADPTTNYGKVDYDYAIGKYEVTNAQYVAFLNAVGQDVVTQYKLYNENMTDPEYPTHGCGIVATGNDATPYAIDDTLKNMPVNHVSFWSAARFCNWLTTNGTSTETGMYDLTDGTALANNTVARKDDALVTGGWALPTENEWYKAAYYDPDKNGPGNAGYYLYPMKKDTTPASGIDANFDDLICMFSEVGSYPNKPSAYGTFDQGGNVYEWNEAIIDDSNRGFRGGSAVSPNTSLISTERGGGVPSNATGVLGFRVIYLAAPIPEPSTYALFGGMALLGLTLLRRKNKK